MRATLCLSNRDDLVLGYTGVNEMRFARLLNRGNEPKVRRF